MTMTGNETDQYILSLYNYRQSRVSVKFSHPLPHYTTPPKTNDASSPGVYFLRRGPSPWERDVHGRVWASTQGTFLYMLLYNVGCNNTRQLYNENFKNSPEIRSKYFFKNQKNNCDTQKT